MKYQTSMSSRAVRDLIGDFIFTEAQRFVRLTIEPDKSNTDLIRHLVTIETDEKIAPDIVSQPLIEHYLQNSGLGLNLIID